MGLGNQPTYYVSRPVTLPSSFPFPVTNVGKYLSTAQHNDWAPRLGFAYSIGAKTVVRGAYGIFWQAEEIGTFSNPSPGFNPPFYIDATFFEVLLVKQDVALPRDELMTAIRGAVRDGNATTGIGR